MFSFIFEFDSNAPCSYHAAASGAAFFDSAFPAGRTSLGVDIPVGG